MQNNINPDSQWIFSSLDYFMANNKANASLFCSLYERKQILIDMLKQKKIDGKKYKVIVIKMLKDENQVVKKCAESDALQLKDPKSEESINQWFESMINKTGAALEQQEKIYTNLKKSANQPQNKSIMQAQEIKQITIQPKNSQVKRQPVTSNITIKGVNLGEITSFKIIDTFLQDEKDPILFQKLLEKKKLMLDLIAKNALNPEKYHFMIVDSLKNGKSQQLISDLKFQLDGLTDFHDGNKNKWFKQIVDEAKDNLQSQEQQLQDLKKGKKGVNKPEVSKIQQKKEQKEDPFPSEPVNMKQVISFKVIEEQLSQNDDNKTIYKTLLQKKLNLLQLYKKGSLTPQSYKNILTKAISQVKNPAVKESMQMQLQQIKDLHQGNIVLWFKDIISNAELFLQDQKQKLGNLEKGIKPKKVVDSDEEIDVDDLEQEIIIDSDQQVKKAKPTKQIKKDASKQIIQVKPTQKFAQKPAKSNQVKAQILQNLSQVYSLKAIDQYCEQNNKNFEVFCKLFERKKQIIQQISSRKITAEIYKELQVKTLKSSKNEKLRDIVEMELMDLKQMCDDDVNKWFEQLINDSGMLYEDQEALYNAIQQKLASKGASVQPSKQAQGGTIKQNSPPKKVQKPQLSQVACLSAITKLFTIAVNTEDYDYYKDLQKKRGQLIDLIAQQRLTSPKYRAINSKASQTAVEIVKNCINEQVNLLKTQFKGDEKAWFDFLTKKFKQNPPYLKSQQSNQMQIINNSPLHRKIEYFLKKMAKYQSIFYYFKKNKIAYEDNKMISSYQKSMRKQVVNCLQMIRKQSDLDVYKLTNKMFPQITPEGFYGVSINSLKQKAMNYCQLIAKEIAMLKDYASKLKKTTNTENISNVKKQITKCQQNIAYLKKWPINSFTPFPLITEQKVEKYNLDLISKLDENDLQVIITRFQGINGELVMNLYVSNMERQRLTCKAVNGYCNYNCIVKLSVKEKLQISKGDKKIISIKLFKRGFFGGLSILAQENIQASFTRNNIIQQTINIGGINVSYCLKIQKPLRPLTTVISHIELKQYPAYKYSENFQQQLIKKYVMYSSPSQSQIISIDP